jgi:hypothetical protein
VERDAEVRDADPQVVELEQPEQVDRRTAGAGDREASPSLKPSVRTVRPGVRPLCMIWALTLWKAGNVTCASWTVSSVCAAPPWSAGL